MEIGFSTSLHILLAEDSESDAFLFRHALRAARLQAGLSVVHDGQEAVDYLEAKPPFSDRTRNPFPDVIVTDLKMPGMDGFDLLEWIKSHADCAVIPAIVLSSSYMEADVTKAYALGANAFLTKPGNAKDLADLLLLTYTFWSRCLRPSVPRSLKCD